MVLGHLGITLFPLLFKRDVDWDVRLLIIGAFLPDIIDKPLGHLVLPQNNGRIIGHTLIFTMTLIAIAFFYRKAAPLAFGTAFHQLLDGIYLDPKGALWPLMGPFETTDYQVVEWLTAYTRPLVIAEELAGLIVLISIGIMLKRKGILQTLIHGRPSTQ